MKLNLRLLLAAVGCLALLTACRSKPEAQPFTPDLVQALVQADVFSEELEELPGETVFALYRLADYGLSPEALTDCAVLRSAGSTCEEAAVLVLDSADSAQLAEQALRDYLDGQIAANRDYRPAEIPKLESARIDRRGETVLLVVANDLEAVPTFGG